MIGKLSNYHLILELLCDGKAGVLLNLEPFNINDLISTLGNRTGHNYGTLIEKWVDWFISEELEGKEEEKRRIRTIYEIVRAEKKALKRLGIN